MQKERRALETGIRKTWLKTLPASVFNALPA
jgi:hypothetical protein